MLGRRTLSARPITAVVAAVTMGVAMGVASAMTAGQNILKDVQVGEKDSLMRIALVCDDRCSVRSLSDGAFEISDVTSSLEIPLESRSKLARSLKIVPGKSGSVLTIVTDGLIAHAKINDCSIRGGPASCIDLAYYEGAIQPDPAPIRAPVNDDRPTAKLAVPEQAPSQKPIPHLAVVKPLATDDAPAANGASDQTGIVAVLSPALRQSPNSDILTFDRFAAPKRLAPPKLAVLTPVKPEKLVETEEFEVPSPSLLSPSPLSSASAPVSTEAKQPPALTEAMPKVLQRSFSLKEQAKTILGKSLDIGACAGAQAKLNQDAWALNAMIDVGFCKAAAGDLEEADRLFTRLLAYTPDNYEALVGRALIAIDQGELDDARKFFQDSLNALPPIKESDLIVEAMARL